MDGYRTEPAVVIGATLDMGRVIVLSPAVDGVVRLHPLAETRVVKGKERRP